MLNTRYRAGRGWRDNAHFCKQPVQILFIETDRYG
jgi:hypothetical protein